jgi:hypothetical protein
MSYAEAIIIPLSLFKECQFPNKPDEIKTLLSEKNIPPDKKMKLVDQIQLKRKQAKRSSTPDKPLSPTNKVLQPSTSEEFILSDIPIAMKPFASSIMHAISPYKDQINWDKNLEITIDGTPYPESNIIKLLLWITKSSVMTRHSDLPIGAIPFHNKLMHIGIPKSWIQVKLAKTSITSPLPATWIPI